MLLEFPALKLPAVSNQKPVPVVGVIVLTDLKNPYGWNVRVTGSLVAVATLVNSKEVVEFILATNVLDGIPVPVTSKPGTILGSTAS